MAWYVYLAYFVVGMFFANGIPHFIKGISGDRFQSPFASPPGMGESSPLVKVLWGIANLLVGYMLVYLVGDFQAGLTPDMFMVGLGFTLMAIVLSRHFGRVRSS